MIRVTVNPGEREYRVEEGENLLHFLQKNHIFPVEALCGGKGTCGRCQVRIIDARPPGRKEEKLLSKEQLQEGTRLACQQVIQEPLSLLIPPERRQEILTTGQTRDYVDATLTSYFFQVDEKREGDSLLQELQDFLEEIGRGGAQVPLSALKGLSQSLPGKEPLPLLVDGNEVFRLGRGRALGMAFDIGTTTVAGYLLDLLTGEQLGVTSALNPQTVYGGDVISRIQHAVEREDGLQSISQVLRKGIKDMIHGLFHQLGLPLQDLLHISMVGNTCMHHLFWELNPYSLGHAPYRPVVTRSLQAPGLILDPSLGEEVRMTFLPNIAGYVGSDTIGAMLATDMANSPHLSLLIDIGTNGEVVLGNRERLLACSTAAGPAFEGARITHGMMAEEGAISRAQIGEDLELTVMGNGEPRGICGSGLVDLVGELIRVGLIDEGGRLLKEEELSSSLPETLQRRIMHEKETCFRLDGAGKVFLTQGDIRQLQLAKGAIQAGIQVLLEEMGVTPQDIHHIYLAGAFGNHIDKSQAQRLGLLPDLPLERVLSVGNAAGEGAKLALLSHRFREEAEDIARQVDYLELARHKGFMDYYTEAMLFPQ